MMYYLVGLFVCLFVFWRGQGRGKRERNINVWLPLMCPLLGTWPTTQSCALDWESNQQPFDSQANTQPLSHTRQGRVFTCIFLITNDVEHLLICLLGICISSWVTVYSSPLSIFEIELFIFLLSYRNYIYSGY